MFVYDVLPDGNLTNHRLFSDRKDGDGLAVDFGDRKTAGQGR